MKQRFGCIATLLGVFLGIAAGCSPANGLSGSLSEVFPLDISRVETVRDTEAFQVSYYANHDTSIDLVVQVTVATADLNLQSGSNVGLDGEYRPGHQRTTVVHMAAGEPLRQLPPVRRGNMVFSQLGSPGQNTHGNFSMSFGSGGDLGDGRDLSGSFSSTLKDGGF
jgi:hypothetical protein